jgi:ribosomal protein S14
MTEHAATHDPAAPPAAPGSGAETWRCTRCGNQLGVVYQMWLYTRHKGREVAACLPARVQCESCGKRNVKES